MSDNEGKVPAAPKGDPYGLKNDPGVFPIEEIVDGPPESDAEEGDDVEEDGDDILGEDDDFLEDDSDEEVDEESDEESDEEDEEADEDDDLDDLDLAEEDDEEEGDDEDNDKTVAFKVDGEDVDIPVTATVTIPYDGGEVEVTFEDLQKSYNGEQFYNKKITEVGHKEKDLDRRIKEYEEGDKFLSELSEKAKNGDPYGALVHIFQNAGLDEGTLLRNWILQANKTFQQIKEKGLTSEQLEAIIAKKSLESERQKSETFRSTSESKDRENRLITLRDTKLAEKGYSRHQYDTVLEDLKATGQDVSDLEPEEQVERVVGQIENFYVPYGRVVKIAKKKLSKQDFSRFMDDSGLLESLTVLARTADNRRVWNTIKAMFTPDDENDESPTSRDSSKRAKKKKATSEKSAPQETEDDIKVNGPLITMDDVIGALE